MSRCKIGPVSIHFSVYSTVTSAQGQLHISLRAIFSLVQQLKSLAAYAVRIDHPLCVGFFLFCFVFFFFFCSPLRLFSRDRVKLLSICLASQPAPASLKRLILTWIKSATRTVLLSPLSEV